jgi:hypothetical protein
MRGRLRCCIFALDRSQPRLGAGDGQRMRDHESTPLEHEAPAQRSTAPRPKKRDHSQFCRIVRWETKAAGVVTLLLSTDHHEIKVGATGMVLGVRGARVKIESVTPGYAKGRIEHEGIEKALETPRLIVMSPTDIMVRAAEPSLEDPAKR